MKMLWPCSESEIIYDCRACDECAGTCGCRYEAAKMAHDRVCRGMKPSGCLSCGADRPVDEPEPVVLTSNRTQEYCVRCRDLETRMFRVSCSRPDDKDREGMISGTPFIKWHPWPSADQLMELAIGESFTMTIDYVDEGRTKTFTRVS